ncbi:SDR family NAD(P)-dependent oxidoreductase [Nonomuraea maritima]|uniref:SDR family NAD(P)-dependent oxidoreductase n=1 Tax=Nonomuraea maritima TaxID=683260 RepID=UPI003714655C
MDKVAVITGASQGIGAALVEAYRKLGYAVVATARGITQHQLSEVLTVPGDLADPATAERVVDTAMEAYGRIDTVVNNAGIFISKPFTDYTDEDLDTYLGVNVRGFFHVTRRAVPHLLAHGDGHIVTVTTSLVDHPLSRVPAVLASLTKGGLQAATRSLAIEYAGRGLRVNAVSPGIVKTPMNPPETYEFAASLHPVGRMGEISDVVQAVVYLERAPFVTGEILHVDGGQSAGH